MEHSQEAQGHAVAADIWQEGFAAGLDAAASTLDPKSKGLSEKPVAPFHAWYSAKKVQSVPVPPTPPHHSQPPSGVFKTSDRPTVPPSVPAPSGGDYTVQSLSDQVEYMKRELETLEAGYQENLRLALAASADHITRLVCDVLEEESKRCFVRMPTAEDLFDKLTAQVRGLALLYETEAERDAFDVVAEIAIAEARQEPAIAKPARSLMYTVEKKDQDMP